MSGVERHRIRDDADGYQIGDGAITEMVLATDYDQLAAENARLERELADVRKKSSARKLELRDKNAKVQSLTTDLARLQAELKEARVTAAEWRTRHDLLQTFSADRHRRERG
jgi:predicted  nucleic acid-binding Zn-ribbon protein